MRFLSMLVLCLFFYSGVVWPCSSHVSFDPNSDHGEGISSAAMINSPTASTLNKNRFAAGFTFNQQRYHTLSADVAHRLHHQGHHVHGKNHDEFYHLNFAYGLLDGLQLELGAPIVSKKTNDVDSHSRLGTDDRSAGFGDMRFGLKYRFWEKGVEAALISGVKFPTGRISAKKENGDKFEAEEQPGSGSWDADFGLALSRRFGERVSVAGSFQYFLRGKGAQEYSFGDIYRLSLGASVALRKLGQYPNLSFVAELNQEWQGRDRDRSGATIHDGGGTTLWFSPGLQADLNSWSSAFVAMPIPVYQNVHGAHEELKYQILSGVSIVV